MAVDLANEPITTDVDREMDHHALAHLRQAEHEVAWLRWLGMAAWVLILLRDDASFGVGGAWMVFTSGLAYAVFAHWRIERAASIQFAARLTSIGDPILAALMCAMTGGIDSLFYPFFYFTLLATAFRLSARDLGAIFALNAILSVVLYFAVPIPDARYSDLFIAIFYLAFSTMLGVMLARWAQQNMSLAHSRERAFRKASDRARALLRRLICAQEEERRTVASDMHDRFGHHLFVLQQSLQSLSDSQNLPDELRDHMKQLGAEAQACSNDVRLMMNELRPTVLDDFGFCEAAREFVARMEGDVPFEIQLTMDDVAELGEPDAEAMLFRILQESLLNIRKHAKATRVKITFGRPRKMDDVRELKVQDNGVGFNLDNAEPGHLGLLTMRERAEALGGRLDITQSVGGGTTVTVTLRARRRP